jgi:hypothetical protein
MKACSIFIGNQKFFEQMLNRLDQDALPAKFRYELVDRISGFAVAGSNLNKEEILIVSAALGDYAVDSGLLHISEYFSDAFLFVETSTHVRIKDR